MVATTKPEALFGAPVDIEGKQVLVVSEVGAAMGIGQVWLATGGGGTSLGRPVATISVQGGKVRIKPVFDFTKIGLALLTAIASFVTMWRKMHAT